VVRRALGVFVAGRSLEDVVGWETVVEQWRKGNTEEERA
jgi:hypothetical protein